MQTFYVLISFVRLGA